MRAALVTLGVILCAVPLFAHEGPEGEIEELTERMKRNGETASLLTERAIEYRVIGKLPEATKDLELALAFAPDSIGAHRELARVLFLGGKANEAIAIIVRGLAVKTNEQYKALMHEIEFAQKMIAESEELLIQFAPQLAAFA